MISKGTMCVFVSVAAGPWQMLDAPLRGEQRPPSSHSMCCRRMLVNESAREKSAACWQDLHMVLKGTVGASVSDAVRPWQMSDASP
jgi:hypothetical protein